MHRWIGAIQVQGFFECLNGPVIISIQVVDLAQGNVRRCREWIEFYCALRRPDCVVKRP
jgi:hypothetical protein